MFIATSLAMLLIPKLITAGSIEASVAVQMAFGFGFLHAFVKAFNEEVIFRQILPIVAGLGDIISNVLFGIFHIAVVISQLSLLKMPVTFWTVAAPVGILVVLGFLWAKIRDRFGLMGATGSHFAYNLGVMQLLPKVFGVVV
jgi:hypothetical protein